MKTTSLKDIRHASPPPDGDEYKLAYVEADLAGRLAELVYTLRTAAGLTQTELARRMGTTQCGSRANTRCSRSTRGSNRHPHRHQHLKGPHGSLKHRVRQNTESRSTFRARRFGLPTPGHLGGPASLHPNDYSVNRCLAWIEAEWNPR